MQRRRSISPSSWHSHSLLKIWHADSRSPLQRGQSYETALRTQGSIGIVGRGDVACGREDERRRRESILGFSFTILISCLSLVRPSIFISLSFTLVLVRRFVCLSISTPARTRFRFRIVVVPLFRYQPPGPNPMRA